jgi:hypothetical protein
MRRFLLPVALLGAFLVPALVPAPATAAGTLTVVIVGKGTVSGSGINCSETGGVCQVSASSATLTGAPAAGYSGPGWEGCQLPLLSLCTMLSVDGAAVVTAVFDDVQAPVIHSVTPPTGSTVSGELEVVADVTDNSGSVDRVQFYVNGTKWGVADTQAPFKTEIWTPPYGSTPFKVEVEAFDKAPSIGNEGLSSGRVAATYTPDNSPPETEILKAPAKRVVVRKKRALVSFVFGASEEGSTFECSVDNHAWEDCAQKQDWILPLGKHVLRVAALDAAGSPDVSPAVYRWSIIRKPRR